MIDTRKKASAPVFSEYLRQWVVDVSEYDGRGNFVRNSTWSFPTQDEAEATAAKANGVLQ